MHFRRKFQNVIIECFLVVMCAGESPADWGSCHLSSGSPHAANSAGWPDHWRFVSLLFFRPLLFCVIRIYIPEMVQYCAEWIQEKDQTAVYSHCQTESTVEFYLESVQVKEHLTWVHACSLFYVKPSDYVESGLWKHWNFKQTGNCWFHLHTGTSISVPGSSVGDKLAC